MTYSYLMNGFGAERSLRDWRDVFDGPALTVQGVAGDAKAFHDHDDHHDHEAAQPPVSYIDIPGNSSTSFETTFDQVFYDRLETSGDRDWIKLDLAAGQHVTIVLNGLGADELIDPYLRLRNSSGTQIAENDDQDLGVILDSRIEFTATTAGVYYIDVGSYGDTYVGDYELLVFNSQSTSDTIAGNVTTGSEIQAGGTFRGVVETGSDADWIAVDLNAGDSYSVRVSGAGNDPLAGAQVRVRNANGEIVGQDASTQGEASQFTFTAGRTGTFYIDVASAGSNTGEYVVAMRKPLEVFDYDQIADQLARGYWGGQERAFDLSTWLTVDLTGLTSDGQFLARAALQTWADVIGFRVAEVTGSANITFQDHEPGAFATSSFSGSRIFSSIVNISTEWLQNSGTGLNSYSFQSYIHEIGHALGLGHAGNYNGNASYQNDALYANDAWVTTIMSYFNTSENEYFSDRGFTQNFPMTPMNADVVAMAELYGLSTTTRTGNSRYGYNSDGVTSIFNASLYVPSYTIVDSGGFDTLDFSQTSVDQHISLTAEVFMSVAGRTGNIMIARGTQIESAHGGSGNDLIDGSGIGNVLFGRGGNDTISGLWGQDLIYAGPGNDTVHGDQGADRLYGSPGDDIVYGDDGDDRLFGEAGSDTLDGGAGDDRLYGAADNDTLLGQGGADQLFGGDGQDVLRAGAQDDLVIGGNGNDRIFGDDGNDDLYGNAGSDRIEGGNGDDFILGGNDDDVLYGQSGSDTIRGETGADLLNGGDGDDSLDGGGGADIIHGGSGDDRINGNFGLDLISGGLGADVLIGGEGSDVFIFDTQLQPTNVDRIFDFEDGIDKIMLDRSVFDSIFADGALASGAFRQGPEAFDGDDRLIYRKDTGELFYDADGVGGASAILFAQVTPGLELDHTDFEAFSRSNAEEPKAVSLESSYFLSDPLDASAAFVMG